MEREKFINYIYQMIIKKHVFKFHVKKTAKLLNMNWETTGRYLRMPFFRFLTVPGIKMTYFFWPPGYIRGRLPWDFADRLIREKIEIIAPTISQFNQVIALFSTSYSNDMPVLKSPHYQDTRCNAARETLAAAINTHIRKNFNRKNPDKFNINLHSLYDKVIESEKKYRNTGIIGKGGKKQSAKHNRQYKGARKITGKIEDIKE